MKIHTNQTVLPTSPISFTIIDHVICIMYLSFHVNYIQTINTVTSQYLTHRCYFHFSCAKYKLPFLAQMFLWDLHLMLWWDLWINDGQSSMQVPAPLTRNRPRPALAVLQAHQHPVHVAAARGGACYEAKHSLRRYLLRQILSSFAFISFVTIVGMSTFLTLAMEKIIFKKLLLSGFSREWAV